ncbi:hypothetical protein M9H77_14813 [Catharanthus roseus]|uniref:Uncharacterized protein n=1 Tax=Catharanthus roseus TaxID=4058 RepID=A0ACC0BP35_CATRO|nr:hypothetical protein M9H77_14813 [Catharanthus roseus]
MKTSTLISLFLLSILVHQAQGIRLVKGSLSAKMHKLHESIQSGLKSSIDVISGLVKPNEELKGRNRKLMTKTTSTTSTTTTTTTKSKNSKNDDEQSRLPGGQKDENLSINSSSSSMTEQSENVHRKHYPDVLDLAGMDYSPAMKKPPIHN